MSSTTAVPWTTPANDVSHSTLGNTCKPLLNDDHGRRCSLVRRRGFQICVAVSPRMRQLRSSTSWLREMALRVRGHTRLRGAVAPMSVSHHDGNRFQRVESILLERAPQSRAQP